MARKKATVVDPRHVDARPEKRFFISMLVKDIELIPAITDLVDNSVDGARADKGDRLRGFEVAIDAEPDRFEIRDNCGGIDIDVAREYAFRFGRPEDFEGGDWSVGQFGVGMKRALFKLGTAFEVESRTHGSYFRLSVDVTDWSKEPSTDWSFDFDEYDDNYSLKRGEKSGTTIRVEPLHGGVSGDFEKVAVLSRLRADLQLRHQQAIADGLKLVLNGEVLRAARPTLVYKPDEIVPIKRRFEIGVNGTSVEAIVIAGIVQGGTDRDDEDPEDFAGLSEAGWYLFCNRRLLFAAERSWLTGWGTVAADYHPQYRNFRGYAFLSAANPALLPWNTTKTGVDEDSPVFRQLQGEMGNALKRVQTAINVLKREVQQLPPADRAVTSAVREAREVPLDDLPESKTMMIPEARRPTKASTTQTIHYSVERGRYDAVKETLEATKPGEVGLATFDHYYRTRVQ